MVAETIEKPGSEDVFDLIQRSAVSLVTQMRALGHRDMEDERRLELCRLRSDVIRKWLASDDPRLQRHGLAELRSVEAEARKVLALEVEFAKLAIESATFRELARAGESESAGSDGLTPERAVAHMEELFAACREEQERVDGRLQAADVGSADAHDAPLHSENRA